MTPPITSIPAIPAIQEVAQPRAVAGTGFGSVLSIAVESVSQSQSDAAASVQRFLQGDGEDLHRVALAQQEASLKFDLFLQVRNKVLSAYQEIMRMPV